jgi:gliding motility-associated protein GldM
MSIPKEPRQLMINLMYLVLTALLALNVSAEVMNAFFSLDDSISSTNEVLGESNNKIIESLEATVEEKPNYKPLLTASKEAQSTVNDFIKYIDEIRGELDEQAGGLRPDDYKDKAKAGKPVRFRDKEIPTRYFVDGQEALGVKQEPVGPEIKLRIEETRDKLVEIVDNVAQLKIDGTNITPQMIEDLKSQISLAVDDETWQEYKKPSWSDFTFGHMPVAACYPILRKFQNDAKNSEATILGFLAKQVGQTVIEFDAFEPVASTDKAYIIKGETYNAEVFLSAFSSQAAENISMKVNGSPLKIVDGKGQYSVTPGSIGEKEYRVDISVTNPFTKETDTYSKTFRYEVGERSVAVSADKMNVFYIGVDNPLSVSAAGVSSNDLRVSISGGGGKIRKVGSNNFVVNVSSVTQDCKITVSGGGLTATKDFRVKMIPDPIARLGNLNDGGVQNGTFKAQAGIIAWLDNFDFEARCNIVGFDMVYQPKNQDVITNANAGATFDDKSKRMVSQAKAGDTYYFRNIRAKCPGDKITRKINSLVFTIR